MTYNDYIFPSDQYCLFLDKKNYKVKLTYVYRNVAWKEWKYVFPEKLIKITSKIEIKNKFILNDNKTEIKIWEAWDKVLLNLNKNENRIDTGIYYYF